MTPAEPPWRIVERQTLALLKTPEDFARFGWPERWEEDPVMLVYYGGDLCVSLETVRKMGLSR